MTEVVPVRLVCAKCGYRAAPGMGWCVGCDSLNPPYEEIFEEEEGNADRDLGKT